MDVVEAACEAAELLSSAPIDRRFVEVHHRYSVVCEEGMRIVHRRVKSDVR